MSRKNIFVILILIILILLTTSSSDNSDSNPDFRLMNWIKTSELDGNDTYSVFKDDIYNVLDQEFNDLTDDFEINAKLSNDECQYYFVNNEYEVPVENEDYLSYRYIYGRGHFYSFAQICADNPLAWDWGKIHYFNCEHWLNLKIDKDNANKDINIKSTVWNHEHMLTRIGTYWVDNWVTKTDESGNEYQVNEGWWAYEYQTQDGESHTRGYDFIINMNDTNTTEPLTSNKIFFDKPDIPYNITGDYKWKQNPGNGDSKDADWSDIRSTQYLYKAKSPNPEILTENSNADSIIHIKDFETSTNIRTQMGVKIFSANFYKRNEDDTFTLKKTYVRKVADQIESDNGINDFVIPPDVYKSLYEIKDDEGTYYMVLGILDKFNKIYIFETEKFIIDKTAPVVTGLELNEENNLNGENPVILKWESITDEHTKDWNEEDFIFIQMADEIEAVPITQNENFVIDAEKKEIKLKNEGIFQIKDFFIQDKAGNRVEIVKNKSYLWDNTPPIIELDPELDVTSYLKSSDIIKVKINENSKVKITELKLLFVQENITYDIGYIDEFLYINEINVSLEDLTGKEGQFIIIITAEDEAGNITNEEFELNIDDHVPKLMILINGEIIDTAQQILYLNHQNILSVQIEDLYFESFDISITSDIAGSNNEINLINDTNNFKEITTLLKSEGTDIERLNIEITARDSNNNSTSITKSIELYDDDSPPLIKTTRLEEGKYRLEVSDVSIIKNIYIKYIDLPESNTVQIDDFEPLPVDNSWLTLASDIRNYDKNIYILPRYASCIFAEDIWENISDADSVGIILENESPPAAFVINSKTDLDLVGWILYGNVLFRTSISVEPGETLNIITNNVEPTKVDFDAGVGQIKIANNGGIINIDSSKNEIQFRGAGASAEEYKWFGFQSISGSINFDGTNKLRFINAVSPVTYFNPSTDITLTNMDFEDCEMGIHFIDQVSSYNNLTINTMLFKNVVYGIKYDIDSYDDIELYEDALKHLNYSDCTFENIFEGHVYCPVKGLIDLQ